MMSPRRSAAIRQGGATLSPAGAQRAGADWSRILDGALYAASSRVDWAVLLQRTYGVNARRCPRCAAQMQVMATIIEPVVVKKILSHLGVRTEPLPRGRARDPTGQESFDFEAA